MSGTSTKTYSRSISILEIYNNSSGNPFSYIIAIRGIGYKGSTYNGLFGYVTKDTGSVFSVSADYVVSDNYGNSYTNTGKLTCAFTNEWKTVEVPLSSYPTNGPTDMYLAVAY